MENPIKLDDFGGKLTIFGNIHMNQNHVNHWVHQEFQGPQIL